MDNLSIFGIILSLVVSALFSGLEIAFISANRLEIALLKEKGTLSGKILSYFLQVRSKFISTMLVGNTIALVVYGIFMAALIEPWLAAILPPAINYPIIILLLQTILSTALVLAIAEFLPKTLFLINPTTMLVIFAIPLRIIYTILQPLVNLIVVLSKVILEKMLKQKFIEETPVFSVNDLRNYLEEVTDQMPEEHKNSTQLEILRNAVDFKKLKVRDCMVHRADLVAIEKKDSIEELTNLFVETGYSKILVYNETIDDIVGYCHTLTLFKKPKSIEDILTPIIIVPETLSAQQLLEKFVKERKSIALVVDEFGGTSGLVTMEDVMEEIVGEIDDETDEQDWTEQQVDENTFVVSAKLKIDYLNEKYGWKIPKGDYETLGGYIIHLYEDIPELNEIIDAPPYTFTIVAKQDAKLETIRIDITEKEK